MTAVEMFICYDDNTWDTAPFDVPTGLVNTYRRSQNPQPIIKWVMEDASVGKNVAFVGIYDIDAEKGGSA